mmetsp:Transcript_29226/g.64686  ORF Transcript_29226/g.64686 Transcript_29226/m.64686 type:complete len:459 (-) Transcript_29226:408-1784(-)|eukprot:CAMPEP_0202899306 /NCGR_PEP_ID=MMETSP1392-20130828/7583_1 /ASSEMBLY_ACC=CAM_ASM_000868 /TAXON_ID=225041 /ORGANISM="Chlamydomonas chlamydogama, Strain SAG 11-48b" /LENGTH=458 /DNA_ID=CAMNT_0049585459 /DNA_START=139 /DNA_END=1515 /DNA_ORIENTATION=-
MAHRLLRDPDQDGWERSDMPIVCESCLGPNPFVRMQRIEFGGTCHISGRPYTVFRWRPGNEARYKKTVICQEVAKAKNVCQVCLLDLDYNLPVQVRDYALGIQNDDEPESAVGKEYKLQREIKEGTLDSSFAQQRPNDVLMRLQRTAPYYKRNEAKICSFFVKGTCNRGAECPYRHEMPAGGELANQNMKDRYYGINDPVANKMLKRVAEMPKLEPPEDTSITTLYIGGVTPNVSEDDLRDEFYAFGEIASLRKVENKMCAFITFTTRAAAEKAAEEKHNQLVLKGERLRVLWGKPQQQPQQQQGGDASTSGQEAPHMLPPQVQMAMGGAIPYQPSGPNFFGLPPGGYASMDPSAMGTRISAPGDAQKRVGGDGDGPDSKRARSEAAAPSYSGYGAPPGYGPPPGNGPPPYGMPPLGFHSQPPAPGLRPPFGMPPPGYGPPSGGPRPPLGPGPRPAPP